jgi:hypothetical protein
MGCAWTRPEALNEEVLIQREEHAMGLASRNSFSLDLILRKYSHSSHLSYSALFQSAKELSLCLTNYDNHLGITRFIQTFNKDNLFKLKRVLIYAVISGIGSEITKAELLFQAYDQKCKHSLSANRVRSMIEHLFAIAIKKSIYLITSQMQPGDGRQSLKKYLNKCSIAIRFCIEEACGYILKNETSITQPRFIERISSFNKGCLLSTSGIRLFAYEFYLANKPQKAIKLPRNKYFKASKIDVLQKFTRKYEGTDIRIEISKDDDGGSTNVNSCSSSGGSGNSASKGMIDCFVDRGKERGKQKIRGLSN